MNLINEFKVHTMCLIKIEQKYRKTLEIKLIRFRKHQNLNY